MNTPSIKTLISRETYIAKCNEILANEKLKDLEKMMALMGYADKVKIATEMEKAFNDFLSSKESK